ncbi:cell envelope biogenesis protein OmpA [Actinomadura sp. KC06]|uniref:cell envelope biogenesis protein OmpA n=1 Tax=Actinomadura sp. KC06 TaxID=2530369 RepID=UPI0010459570|nr:cell envelope biogenesis protein OmpA [Actinomadura sp. KC06]TDD31668.1 cell envelope biogenesis protein OmpA [Actinomadura sp. KC06]
MSTATGGRPPIPLRCANRPTASGLVVPWVTLQHPHAGWLLGQTRADLMAACVRKRRCQTCGEPLGDRVVVVCRPEDLGRGYSAEPGMHPECAAYAIRACPMLAGCMDHHRRRPVVLADLRCDDAACACNAWSDSPDKQRRAGQPADDYLTVWLAAAGYRPAYEGGRVVGVALRGVRFLRLRHIPGRAPASETTRGLRALDAIRALLTDPVKGGHGG